MVSEWNKLGYLCQHILPKFIVGIKALWLDIVN